VTVWSVVWIVWTNWVFVVVLSSRNQIRFATFLTLVQTAGHSTFSLKLTPSLRQVTTFTTVSATRATLQNIFTRKILGVQATSLNTSSVRESGHCRHRPTRSTRSLVHDMVQTWTHVSPGDSWVEVFWKWLVGWFRLVIRVQFEVWIREVSHAWFS